MSKITFISNPMITIVLSSVVSEEGNECIELDEINYTSPTDMEEMHFEDYI